MPALVVGIHAVTPSWRLGKGGAMIGLLRGGAVDGRGNSGHDATRSET